MIKLIDSVIPQDILDSCIQEAEVSKNYGVLHPGGDGFYGFKYNWTFAPVNEPEKFVNKPFISLWEEVKKHLPDNVRLHRAYVNAHTYGVEDGIHTDDKDIENGLTVIVYLCNSWYPEWFGQTMFFESVDRQTNEIVCSVLPKYNRVLIFDKSIPHCVSPLSRKFTGIRLTCMFKVELVK
jgi:hypothetical protein